MTYSTRRLGREMYVGLASKVSPRQIHSSVHNYLSTYLTTYLSICLSNCLPACLYTVVLRLKQTSDRHTHTHTHAHAHNTRKHATHTEVRKLQEIVDDMKQKIAINPWPLHVPPSCVDSSLQLPPLTTRHLGAPALRRNNFALRKICPQSFEVLSPAG